MTFVSKNSAPNEASVSHLSLVDGRASRILISSIDSTGPKGPLGTETGPKSNDLEPTLIKKGAELVKNGAELDARPPGKSSATVSHERGPPCDTVGQGVGTSGFAQNGAEFVQNGAKMTPKFVPAIELLEYGFPVSSPSGDEPSGACASSAASSSIT